MTNEINSRLQDILEDAGQSLNNAGSLEALNEIRVRVLGKKGRLTEVLKSMKDVAPEERPAFGQLVNDARKTIETRLD